MKKTMRWAAVLCVLALLLCLCGCRESDPSGGHAKIGAPAQRTYGPEDTWAIYWYLCGGSPESLRGAATRELRELEQTVLPDNVQVVVQTGGAPTWEHEQIYAEELGRYVYSGNELTLVDTQPLASMGESDTLASFLWFCEENYPADHAMVVFWNHGDGAQGVVCDAIHRNDCLTLGEMYVAFQQVYRLSTDSPPLEAVGFDAGLMATMDTAYALWDVSRYMVASQESAPGCGWLYSQWVQALGDCPAMDGRALGQAICDSYVVGCQEAGIWDNLTLSVLDLQQFGYLLGGYETMAEEALRQAYANPKFLAKFGRAARAAENYGGNTPLQGYSNHVDLGHLARTAADLLPGSAPNVLDGINACVVYRVGGPYHLEASGLSCYYPYNRDERSFQLWAESNASLAFQHLYDYGLTGVIRDEGRAYAAQRGYTYGDLSGFTEAAGRSLAGVRPHLDEEGCSVLPIGAGAAAILREVNVQLCRMDAATGEILLMGGGGAQQAYWNNGFFRDELPDTWGTLDGVFCTMERMYSGQGYDLYAVPILLDGEECCLQVVHEHQNGQYRILGAKRGRKISGLEDGSIYPLQPGAQVTPLHKVIDLTSGEQKGQARGSTFTVTENTAFYERELYPGTYQVFYDMVDIQGNVFHSAVIPFFIEDDTEENEEETAGSESAEETAAAPD